ncbi:MAG TPA: SLBB domain-containing protein [Steroidobacteraceae bacterium]|nr:SLBB domain-containing protein [Steroidobacteraceae bacterium]
MKRTVWTFVAAVWLAFSVAAAQTPTADQLEIFRNLTPEQQQALLEGRTSPPEDTAAPRASDNRPAAAGAEDTRRRAAADTQVEPLIPVLKPEDTVLVEPALLDSRAGELAGVERERLNRLMELIRSRNPYQLDRNGQLNLPGFVPIALSGLSEEQATQRLSLEPALLPLNVRLSRLPLARTGVAGLKRFGYDLFDNAPSTFSPVTDAPVPVDYVVGAGDVLDVQLYGSQNRNLRLTVGRDGVINFPDLGPIRVSGMIFNAARQVIEGRVSQQLIGVQASVSISETRSIRVLVTGDVRYPGSYTVDGFATMITALFASGGATEIGSLRNIQLMRQGAVVRRFDLYDLLIRGDTSDDAQLLPGDVIFIPPVGPTVSVDGEVKRPAIYELRDQTSVADVVRMAGGLTPEADTTRASLTQLDQANRRPVVDVNLTQPADAELRVANGAVLRIARLRPQIDAGVELEGFVHRPGPVAWREGLRLTQVIGSIDELLPNADKNYVLIRRESGPDRRISSFSADLIAALAAPGSAADITLAPRDRIVVFDLAPGRERIIRSLLDELRLQSGLANPTEVVEISGRVKVPGEYPQEPGMRISDLLRAGGGLDSAAYGATAELIRSTVTDADARLTELIEIDLAAVRRGDAGANIQLQPFDHLIVKETPEWGSQESVTLRGEVRFPGTYPIRRGETLVQLLERAGGLTTLAFAEGSAFTREDLRELEQAQLDRLAERARGDLANMALQAANAGPGSAAEVLQSGQSLLAELQQTRATGRFVIDLPGLLAEGAGSNKDVLLRNGDELYIPRLRQEVTVIGEVQNATSHLFLSSLSRDDYVNQSGGTSRRADRGRIYVVRADGSVATRSGSRFARNYNVAIKPGDTIVVPMDTERMPRLPFWQAVTQILYNVAVSVAAVNSF